MSFMLHLCVRYEYVSSVNISCNMSQYEFKTHHGHLFNYVVKVQVCSKKRAKVV